MWDNASVSALSGPRQRNVVRDAPADENNGVACADWEDGAPDLSVGDFRPGHELKDSDDDEGNDEGEGHVHHRHCGGVREIEHSHQPFIVEDDRAAAGHPRRHTGVSNEHTAPEWIKCGHGGCSREHDALLNRSVDPFDWALTSPHPPALKLHPILTFTLSGSVLNSLAQFPLRAPSTSDRPGAWRSGGVPSSVAGQLLKTNLLQLLVGGGQWASADLPHMLHAR